MRSIEEAVRLHRETIALFSEWDEAGGDVKSRMESRKLRLVRRGVFKNPGPRSDPPLTGPCVYCAPKGWTGQVVNEPCTDECRKMMEGME